VFRDVAGRDTFGQLCDHYSPFRAGPPSRRHNRPVPTNGDFINPRGGRGEPLKCAGAN
jgi:hypothetical protein